MGVVVYMYYIKIIVMFDLFFFKINDVIFREFDVKIFLLNISYICIIIWIKYLFD